MIQRRPLTQRKLAGGVLLGAVASALTAAALSGAGQANATCVSISGTTNGGGCSNNSYSFGGYKNYAPPPLPSDFNTTIVVGKNSNAYAVGPALKLAGAFGNAKTSSTAG